MEIIKGGITNPKGFQAAGEHVGIKKSKKDLAIIYSQIPANCSAVFTKNIVKAPPLLWCENVLKQNSKINAIVINSGNANACTGERGYDDAVKMARTLAQCLKIGEKSVLVTSTGVIGVFLPTETVVEGINDTCKKLSVGEKADENCAEAILTTDTFTKEISVKINIQNIPVKISGIAKGSGMIHPNMATMLAFVTTDAAISQELLDCALKECVEDSFNMISVDGQTSTNDMAVILANGAANNPVISSNDDDFITFKNALYFVCENLAKQIVKDGEGATKFIETTVFNSKSKTDAQVLCKSILTSNLVKTAIFGQDANWGRILSAMGASGVGFNPEKVEINFKSNAGQIKLFENGIPLIFDEDLAFKILSEKEIEILIDMKDGQYQTTGWGCDLTFDYVKINAEYRT